MANDTKTGAAGAATSTTQQAGTEQQAAGNTNAGASGSASSSSSSGDAGKAGDAGTPGQQSAGGGQEQQQQQTGDQGKDDKGGKAGDSKETPKVPDKYQLAVPEDAKAFVDDTLLKRFEDTARTAGMTNDEAQAFLEDQLTFAKSQAAAWETETKADPDYGGDKLEETQRLAKKVIDRVRPDGHARRGSFLSFLGRGGAGNHIEVVAFLADLGRMMGEDQGAGHARGARGGSGTTTADKASRLYDHADSKAADQATR